MVVRRIESSFLGAKLSPLPTRKLAATVNPPPGKLLSPNTSLRIQRPTYPMKAQKENEALSIAQLSKAGKSGRVSRLLLAAMAMAVGSLVAAEPAKPVDSPAVANLWAHDNLVAWCVVPFDAKKRGPEERAEMLARLGFRHFAYDWRPEHTPTFDAEIDALKKHGVNLHAWWFPFEASDPAAKDTLEVFRRHEVHPQLWVMQLPAHFPKTPEEWAKLLPKGLAMPKNEKELEKLSKEDQATIQSVVARLTAEDWPKTAEEQQQRVFQSADRIAALAKLAAPYGCRIGLYNHNGWFGITDNQLAVISRLQEIGVTNVGMVYNFSHARDQLHDDTIDFLSLWKKLKPHVMAVNITGMCMDGQIIYPSQGDSELGMMRTIQESGWTGPIGLIAEKGGDAEVTLKNYLIGLDWLAAEIKQPGSAGPRPFPNTR